MRDFSKQFVEGTYKYFLPEVYNYNLFNSITMVTTIVLFLFWGSILEVSGKIHVEVSSKIVLTFNWRFNPLLVVGL